MLSNSCSPSTASYSDGKIVHCKVKSALHALEGYPLDPASLVLKVQITLYKSNNNPPLQVKRGGKEGETLEHTWPTAAYRHGLAST